jgi:predicted ATPase
MHRVRLCLSYPPRIGDGVDVGARPSHCRRFAVPTGRASESYLFKHALVQDAAYGMLLREPRRALHTRIAEILESQFAEIAEPDLLAYHRTEAALIEKAASLSGKAGQRSVERSALMEVAAQLTRGVDHIAALPATPAQRGRVEAVGELSRLPAVLRSG